ncbi:MAG: DUF6036 family nucleotidyltransferase, partial [Gemmatimonadaceae bacterium]
EVRFIIIGGIAVMLNGFARTTIDVDILVENSPDNIARLLRSLARFGEGHARQLSIADFADAEGAVRIIEEFPLDVFTLLQGKRYGGWMNSVKRIRIGDAELAYLSAEALIAIKRDSHREIDRIDVSALRAAQQTRG